MGIRDTLPAYLQVRRDGGRLISWGGNVSNYGISDLQIGKPIGEQLCFMAGLLPVGQSPFYLSCVKTEFGQPADIHIFSGDKCDWILLMDAGQEEVRNALLQQKTNDLSLLRKIMFDDWSPTEVDDTIQGIDRKRFCLPEGVSFREVSVLRANIRSSDLDIEKESSEDVFKNFEKHLKIIKLPIIDAGGILMSIFGTVITALFGVLPAVTRPADQAVSAAIRMVGAVNDMNKVYRKRSKEIFEIGVGIATGSVVLGFRGGATRSFNAVGYPVEEVVKLGCQANPFEIVIDQNTWAKIELEMHRKRFSEVVPNLKGAKSLSQSFSCRVEL